MTMHTIGKKLACILFAAGISLSVLSGCQSKPGEKTPGEKTTLVFHLAGSLKEGKNDAAVKEAIEKKFEEDTGIAIDLQLKLHSNEDFNTKVNLAISSKEQMDGIINYIGSNDGLNQFMSKPGFAADLTALIEDHAPEMKKIIPQIAFDTVTVDGKVLALPGVEHEHQFGILIRKDWLDDAGLALPKTLEEFEAALRAFKTRGDKVVPLVGAPWDVDRVILPGAYGLNSYSQRTLDADGKLVPGYLAPGYKQVLIKEYDWVKEGLWDRDNSTRPTSSMDNLFIGGQSGVYVQWPEITHLIEIARKTKAADPDAELEIIGPLTGPDGKSGFAKQNMAFNGLLIPRSSKNAELVIKYVNWLCADQANYELAAYGIEGQDWVDKGDSLRAYPEGKEEEYLMQPPYSGAYKLLFNIKIADRVMTSYSEKERQWIENVRQYPAIADPSEGIFFPALDQDMKTKLDTQYNEFAGAVVSNAWAGMADPRDSFDGAVSVFRANAADYLAWLDEYYQAHKKG